MSSLALPRAKSLLARVMTGVLTILFLGGVLVTLTAWSNGRQAARQAYDRILIGAANDIAESIRIIDGQPVTVLPVSAFELLAQAPDDRITYAVRGPDLTLLTGHDTAPLREGRADTEQLYDGVMNGEDARFIDVTRRFSERDFSGVVRVTVGQTRRARDQMAFDLTLDALIPMGVAGAALVLVAFFIVRSALRPLEAIAGGFSQRDPYDLTPLDDQNVPAEVGVILHAMNRFMQRLDRQIDAMRNLISDTAHQLRTPVAAIRAQAESVTEEDDPERAQIAIARLLKRTRSLGVLLDQMLSRALVIHRTDSVPRAMVDLRDVALDIVDSRDHELLAPNVEVELVIGSDPVLVSADEFSLSEAVKNLLSNALRYGTPPVRIGVKQDGDRAILWVEDAGKGPDDAVLARLGSRFERTASSREDSAGIGLSIVTAVAQAFDGKVEMQKTEHGFSVALVLPHVAEDQA